MKKEVIEIEVQGTGKAVKQVDKVKKSVKEVKTETKQAGEAQKELSGNIDKLSGGAIGRFKGMVSSIKTVVKGFNAMKIAIIGTGIGALLIALLAVKKAFTSSEEGQNKFAKIMGVIGALTGNLVDLLADLGEKIISVFENPKQALKDFTKLLKENIINRFEGLLELIPKLGEAVSALFKGQFSKAGKIAVNAVAKVTLGTENLTKSIDKATESLKKFTKEQIKEGKDAAKVADMRAKADIIDRKLIVERSILESKIAKLRLKSRQEDQFGAEERKQALIDAQKLEDTLLDKETKALELRRDAQILENTFSRTDKENKTKEAEAIAAVNRQVANRANIARQVQRELNTIQGQLDAENNARENRIKAEKERKRLEEEKERKLKDKKLQEDLDKSHKAALQKIKDEELLAKQKINLTKNTFNQLAVLLGKNSKAAKVASIAAALINTYQGISEVWSKKAESPFLTASIAQKVIASAFVASQGFATVKAIGKTPVPVGASGQSTAGGAVAIPQIQTPSFNIVGSGGQNQLAQAIAGQTNQPIQAFVVSSEVTTAQELDRNIVKSSSLG